MNTKVYIVIPCYNEEEVLPETSKQLSELFTRLLDEKKISPYSRILFVDDGSRDKTWEIISDLSKASQFFSGLKLSHNVGHQNALLAGLMKAREACDCAISIDSDLQDDILAIPQMLEKYENGADIVYGIRKSRKTDTFFKRNTAKGFYRFMKTMGADIVYNHADYRLMSKRSLDALSQYREQNLFLRGIVPLLGFKTENVYYDRSERFAGESKYPFKKMLAFALEGITSFSVTPIRLITIIGFLTCIASVLMTGYAIVQKLLNNTDAGWASIICSIWFIGGLQILGIGLIGEYIGKIYKEVKARPRYNIEEYVE